MTRQRVFYFMAGSCGLILSLYNLFECFRSFFSYELDKTVLLTRNTKHLLLSLRRQFHCWLTFNSRPEKKNLRSNFTNIYLTNAYHHVLPQLMRIRSYLLIIVQPLVLQMEQLFLDINKKYVTLKVYAQFYVLKCKKIMCLQALTFSTDFAHRVD